MDDLHSFSDQVAWLCCSRRFPVPYLRGAARYLTADFFCDAQHAQMQEEEDEEADPTYVHVYEEFDDLQSDKAPMLSSNRPSSATSANKKKSFTAKVTQQVYKVFDEACRDINIVASAIDITENVQKVACCDDENFGVFSFMSQWL